MLTENKFSRRSFLLGSSALVTSALLAGCVPAGGQPPAAQSSSDAAAPAGEDITIIFHDRLGSHADWHKQRVAMFEEQNPGIKLQIDEIPADEMFPKVYSLAAGGGLGDIVWTYLNTTLEHLKKGVVAPLDDIITATGFDLSPFWASTIQVLTLDGKLYAMPNHGHFGTVVYYYNKKLYEEAGLDEPNPDWTVDDLVAGAQKITKAPDVFGFRAQGGGDEHLPSYLRTFGGDTMNAEGTKALFSDEKSAQGLKWLYDLKETYKVDSCLCGDQVRESFVAGTLGCYNWTPGFVAEFVKVTDWTFEWGVTVAPKGPDGTRGSQVSGGSFCLTPASKHPNETFKVLEFFATKEDGIQHVLGGAGSPGARNDVWTSQELNDFNSIYGEIIKAYPDGAPPWYYPANGRASEFAETRDNNLQAIWTNEVEFDAGVEQVQELCQEVMDKEPL